FAPTNAASFSNLVTFTTGNAGTSTNPVTGTGALVPAAAFSGTPTNGRKPLTVTFTDTSSGSITNRLWDFGDGTITNTTTTNFTHVYTSAGTNTVTLTAFGPVGTNLLSRAAYVVATNLPAQLALGPASLNFGTLIVGQTNTLSFQLTNS